MSYGIKHNETNIELVRKYMDFGSPLNQAFLIDSVSKQAEFITENEQKVIDDFKASGCDSWINPLAWIQSAKDWIQCLEDRRKPAPKPETEPIYFMFGEEACKVLLEEDFEELVSQYENNDVDFSLYKYTGNIHDLLGAMDGWHDWAEITNEQYEILSDL